MKCGHDDCFTCPFDDCIVDAGKVVKSAKKDGIRKRRIYQKRYYERHKEEIRKRQHEYYLRQKAEKNE